MKNPIIKFFDWYIRNYHADDYIHTSQIQSEIQRRIENAVSRINSMKDAELEEVLKTEKTKHKIECDGYIAEIKSMEKIVIDAKKIRSDAESLYFRVIERASQLVLITAENKHERTEIINDLSGSMGRLDKLVKSAQDINIEIEKHKEKDEKMLRLK